MSWILQITPQGEILNKYLKNNFLFNTDSVLNVERNHFLGDFYVEIANANKVDIKFNLDIYDDNPINRNPKPSIVGFANICISNDPNFVDVITLTPNVFVNYYNNETNYEVDLSQYNILEANFISNYSPIFAESNGSGIITLKNWPLSGSTGTKKVYIRLSVELTDGSIITYPLGYDSFDQITVFSNNSVAPGQPQLQTRTLNNSKNYSVLPIVFASKKSSNSASESDSGVAAYFWDSLFLNSNLYRNNANSSFDLFSDTSLITTNSDNTPSVQIPQIQNVSPSNTTPITINSSNTFSFSTNENILFYECAIANTISSDFVFNNNVLTYTHLLLQGSSKSFTSEIILTDKENSITLNLSTYTASNVLKATKQFVINDSGLASEIVYGGTFIYLFECLDFVNGVFQIKILYRSDNQVSYKVLIDTIFNNDQLILGSIKHRYQVLLSKVSGSVSFEANQYGICYGTISAATLPQENLISQNVVNDTINLTNNEYSFLYSSPLAASITSDSVNQFNFVGGLTTNINNTNNTLAVAEIQGNVPTFSENDLISLSFDFGISQSLKASWSYDNQLNFNDFTSDQNLLTSTGVQLPQQKIAFTLQSNVTWSDNSNFDFNIYDVGVGETCNLSNPTTSKFFHVRNESPQIIKTKNNLTDNSSFNFWLNTNGASTNSVQKLDLIFSNTGTNQLTVTGNGINTLLPTQSLLFSSISTQSISPSTLSVFANNYSPSESLNFLYDVGSSYNTVTALYISIQTSSISNILSPNFDYSIEYSNDFISWTSTSATPTVKINAPTKLTIIFSFVSALFNARFIRLRFYKTASLFDPTQNNTYSNLKVDMQLASINNFGKLMIGFTDTQAKTSSLGTLYNQPTYLRQFQTNNSNYYGLILDFTDYISSKQVYLSSFSKNGEKRIKTFVNNFSDSNTTTLKLNLKRQKTTNSYKIQPNFSLSTSAGQSDFYLIQQYSNDVLDTFTNIQTLDFGLYPFVSLIGGGAFKIKEFSVKPSSITFDNDEETLRLLSGKDPIESVNFGKNILHQNSYNPALLEFPTIGEYFSLNTIKTFDLANISFSVRAAMTEPVVLFGTPVVDSIIPQSGDYILVTAQPDKSQNGVYQVTEKQWTQIFSLPAQPTIYVSEGAIFNDTLWMFDVYSQEWISNVISTQFVIDNNELIFSDATKNLLYPNYIKIALSNLLSHGQSKVKIVQSPNAKITNSDISTNWISSSTKGIFGYLSSNQPNIYNYAGFNIPSSDIIGISTVSFPSVYTLLLQVVGYSPYYTENSKVTIDPYGTPYRTFNVPLLINQMFSSLENISLNNLSNGTNVLTDVNLQSSVYSLNSANLQSNQSKISEIAFLNNNAPILPTLKKVEDNIKNVVLGFNSNVVHTNELLLARIIQRNPLNETFYGSWFGFNTSSYTGISSFVAFPNFYYSLSSSGITSNSTISYLSEPLTGYYKYSLQVMDSVGNLAQTNEVESFYYEQAIVDTQAPVANVSFVNPNTHLPISISSSNIITSKLIAKDFSTAVKAFRYKFYGENWSAWNNYSEFSELIIPDSFPDGTVSVEFEFKDFADNTPTFNANIPNETIYTYGWNIISKLLSNVIFTVMCAFTLNTGKEILLIGASKNNTATLFVWDNNKLYEVSYASFAYSKAITAIYNLNQKEVVIGTDQGYIYSFQNGIIYGPHTQLTWSSIPLSISCFEINTFSEDDTEYIFASTLTIPRIFYTPSNQISNNVWVPIETDPISVTSINILNSGLWANGNFSYSISSSYVPAEISIQPSYGISSVIINNSGSGYSVSSKIKISGAISGAYIAPVLQGKIISYNVIANGIGYTHGVNVIIDSPGSGINTSQAVAIANTDSSGTVQSVLVYGGAYGYGYTQVPNVSLVGVGGFGSNAAVQAVLQYDSIKYANVVSAGIATTTQISLTLEDPTGSGSGAILTPSFFYSISSVNLASPGFGYTSSPTLTINGISTLANVFVKYGSISNITLSSNSFTFPITQPITYSFSGGVSSNWQGIFNTTAVSYSDSTTTQSGVALTSITLLNGGLGLGQVPEITFANYLYPPKYEFAYSNDLIFASSEGSIYSIKSFNNDLYAANSQGNLIKISKENSKFNVARIANITESSSQDKPLMLETHLDNLYLCFSDNSSIGKLITPNIEDVFTNLKYNTLLFEPYNFDVLSDWQLVKNSAGSEFIAAKTGFTTSVGVGTAQLINTGNGENNYCVKLQSYYSQIFYESTKTSIWFDRVSTYNELLGSIINYSVSFKFTPFYGTQSAEITTFASSLKLSFKYTDSGLYIYFAPGNTYKVNGENTLPYIAISILDNVVFVKSQNDLLIYINNLLHKTYQSFFSYVKSMPVFRFGYIFEPDLNTNTFALTYNNYNSSFNWNQIKFAFASSALLSDAPSQMIEIVSNFSEKQPVRVLKELSGSLFAATKGLFNTPSSTTLVDSGVKIYQLNDTTNVWSDVTGDFEVYKPDSGNYVLGSPNDIACIGAASTVPAFYVTGVIKDISSRVKSTPYILLGASSNIIYEEEQNYLSIFYPVNNNASGAYVYLNSNNSLLNVPSNVYFSPTDINKTVIVGVGSTTLTTSAKITATDGSAISTVTYTVNPLIISSFGFSTSTFIGNSTSQIIATAQLPSRTVSSRTINITGTTYGLITVPNSGIATFASNTNTVNIPLQVGVATNVSKTITLTANYPPTPNQVSTASSSLTITPLNFSVGFSTTNIVGGALDTPLIVSASVNSLVSNNQAITITTNLSGFITSPTQTVIIPAGFANTQIQLLPAGFTTQKITGFVTFSIPGTTITTPVSINSFTFSSQVDNLSPVFPYQTPRMIYQLNNVPFGNFKIYNYVIQPTGVGLTYAPYVTFATGQTLQSFSMSTTLDPGAGLAITAYGQLF